MEDILEVYQRPRDPSRPLVCVDEFAKQLLAHAAPPLAQRPGSPAKEDYEYVRHGSVTAFMLFAPFEGWREVYTSPSGQRTALDYAEAMRVLAEDVFVDAEKIILVQDNLDTHVPASLYKAFPAQRARRIVERFEWHYTPKHGSWLNMAENEIGVFTRTVLPQRVATMNEFRMHAKDGCQRRNAAEAKVTWTFTAEKAREKMAQTYPPF